MASRIVNEYRPETVSHPGGTLEDVLEERGMSQTELAERTGRPKKAIQEIMRGKAAITPETAIQFERALGIPASFWSNRQRRYDEYMATRTEEQHSSHSHAPAMISTNDRRILLAHAKKYKLTKVILFGSSKEKADARDIDIAVRGIAPEVFFDFGWELYRDLSKPVDVVDLNTDCLFNKLIEKDGVVLYG